MPDAEQPAGSNLRPEARLGAALRAAREERGLSLRAMARKLHYSAHSNLVEYERGHRLAPRPVVEGYEAALGLRAGSLLSLHDDASRELFDVDGSSRPPSRSLPGRPDPPPDPPRRRRTVLLLAAGVAVVVGAVVFFGLLTGGRDEPRRLVAGPVTVEEPDGARVPQCWLFQGTADLPADMMVALGVENLTSKTGVIYFEAVIDWETGETGQGRWSARQYFGPGDSSVTQVYAVHVVAIRTAAVADLVGPAGFPEQTTWESAELPEKGRVLRTLRVERIAGSGAC